MCSESIDGTESRIQKYIKPVGNAEYGVNVYRFNKRAERLAFLVEIYREQ